MAKGSNGTKTSPRNEEKRARLSQADCPAMSLSAALKIAQSLWDNFAGKSTSPINLANALEILPSSSGWRMLCGASIAYGLTEGGYNATQISLTSLGRRIIAPTLEGDDASAKVEASLKPRVASQFFEKYENAKFPKDSIAESVLVDMGIPRERAQRTIAILKENANFVGVLREIKGEIYVALTPSQATGNGEPIINDDPGDAEKSISDPDTPKASLQNPIDNRKPITAGPRKVFISHGSNKAILDAVKEIVIYGKFDPVVSVQRESVAKPVPQKIMDDMSSCDAGVIHVAVETKFFDKDGEPVQTINENVLIEIGAAMALYKRNFILLVPDGVVLPSNLQGLYECRYTGDTLDAPSTMKLLRAFNDFKFD